MRLTSNRPTASFSQVTLQSPELPLADQSSSHRQTFVARRKEAQALVIVWAAQPPTKSRPERHSSWSGRKPVQREKSQKQRKAEDLGVRSSARTISADGGHQPPEDLNSSTTGSAISSEVSRSREEISYLQMGMIRPVMRTHTETYYPFSDCSDSQVSAELGSAPSGRFADRWQAERRAS